MNQMQDVHAELAAQIAQFYDDPLGHVLFSYPWGTGQLTGRDGPQEWQRDMLEDIGEEVRDRVFNGVDAVAPLQFSTSSGHGIGKSAIVAWLIRWIMDTRPFAKGVVTANTVPQLRTKTWAELSKWHNLGITKHWFALTSGQQLQYYHKDYREQWRVDGQTAKEENSESFAGLHAANSTPFYIFDEACHDEETEVMTDVGWLPFREVTPQHLLLTPEGWQTPQHVHAAPYVGTMYTADKRGLSLKVTPNHDLYGRTQKGVLKKVHAEDLSKSGLISPRVVDWSAPDADISDDEIRLWAWYASEGHLLRNTYQPKTRAKAFEWHGFGLTNNEDRGISDLLDRLGVRWSKHGNQWLVYDKARAEAFAEWGVGCTQKAVPAPCLHWSRRQLRLFLQVYLEGDGYQKDRRRGILYTSSHSMADRLHEMAVLAGYNSSLTRRRLAGQVRVINDHTATSTTDGWVVSLSETGAGVKLTSDSVKPMLYSGMVYCATVPAGLLLTRREGTVIWSGNSGIPDKIFEVREGGLTDGEPMTFDFGNPTRNSGRFYQNMEGRHRHRYFRRWIDSRDVEQTNKELFNRWAEDYGEDSDFFKVRVRGLFPDAGSLQLIPMSLYEDNVGLDVHVGPQDPLIMGVDVARFGDDRSVIWMRQGRDAESQNDFDAQILNKVDTMTLASRIVDIANAKRPDGILIDGGGVGGGVIDRCRQLGLDVIEVNFGAKATQRGMANMRSQMYSNLKDALKDGVRLPEDEDLRTDLTSIEYGYNLRNDLQLERKEDMKKRGLASPDLSDALALTYALPVYPNRRGYDGQQFTPESADYDPF